MWQKCPICEGEGTHSQDTTISKTVCPTCNGMRIISEITGLAPVLTHDYKAKAQHDESNTTNDKIIKYLESIINEIKSLKDTTSRSSEVAPIDFF